MVLRDDSRGPLLKKPAVVLGTPGGDRPESWIQPRASHGNASTAALPFHPLADCVCWIGSSLGLGSCAAGSVVVETRCR